MLMLKSSLKSESAPCPSLLCTTLANASLSAHTMIDVESVSFILLRCPIAVNGLDKSLYTGTAQTLHILIVPYLIIIYGDTVDNRNRGRSLHLIHS